MLACLVVSLLSSKGSDLDTAQGREQASVGVSFRCDSYQISALFLQWDSIFAPKAVLRLCGQLACYFEEYAGKFVVSIQIFDVSAVYQDVLVSLQPHCRVKPAFTLLRWIFGNCEDRICSHQQLWKRRGQHIVSDYNHNGTEYTPPCLNRRWLNVCWSEWNLTAKVSKLVISNTILCCK